MSDPISSDHVSFLVQIGRFFPESDIVWAALIGSAAYLLKGWMDRNRWLLDQRVNSSAAAADALVDFFAALNETEQMPIELALRKAKAAQPKMVLFCSRRTEEKALIFLKYANELSGYMGGCEVNSDASIMKRKKESSREAATNFLNSLRLDILSWSRFGMIHRISTCYDRFNWRRNEGKKK
ncbi:hypothetical protein [Sulfitobacter sp.]|uniref:hypothetical protein n=1 Tax=Sulfitobacter sp. TaxID=1903071 RepID=UPI00300125BC